MTQKKTAGCPACGTMFEAYDCIQLWEDGLPKKLFKTLRQGRRRA